MKRITGTLTAAIMMMSAFPALADIGDVAGQYYSTDINTYLNGEEISSINIGGQTLISAEDMEYYSFSVYWDGEARRLDIYKMPYENSGPPPVIKKSNYPSGMLLGDYYETDIMTLLDGKPAAAYNIGGRTYIHAEQMRDWGYVVEWNETDRNLFITSPDRAGYEYNINLSEAIRPETNSFEDDGEGAFAISHENGKLTGCGDATLFGSSLGCDGTKYTVHMSFYQHKGLFFSGKLQELLNSLCYFQYGTKIAEPEEKYGFISENANIVINGIRAENVKVTKYGGNGHVDFNFEITNIPLYKKDEIKSIYFSAGNITGMKTYDIIFEENEADEIASTAETLKKYPGDFIQSTYYAEDYAAVYICESPSMGIIKDRLYIIDRKTKNCSEDILEQVRSITGFSSDILHPFAFAEGDIKSNFFFSCAPDGRTGDFFVDTKTGIVYTAALSEMNKD